MPITLLGALQILTELIFKTSLGDMDNFCSHLTDEETGRESLSSPSWLVAEAGFEPRQPAPACMQLVTAPCFLVDSDPQ